MVSEYNCCICYEDKSRCTTCNHCICKDCIVKSIIIAWKYGKNYTSCPICRKKMSISCYYDQKNVIINYDNIFFKIESQPFLILSGLNSLSLTYFSGGIVWGRLKGRLRRFEKLDLVSPVCLKTSVRGASVAT